MQDAALAVLQQTDYPSIGFFFANALEPASENLWELADALMQGTGMNSRNHHMWSSFSHYLVRHVAGLDTAGPGWSSLLMKPASVDGLSRARITMATARGDIGLSWERSGGIHSDKVAAVVGQELRLDCGPQGGVIKRVLFASYGHPRVAGHDGQDMVVDSKCHAPSSVQVLEEACLGTEVQFPT